MVVRAVSAHIRLNMTRNGKSRLIISITWAFFLHTKKPGPFCWTGLDQGSQHGNNSGGTGQPQTDDQIATLSRALSPHRWRQNRQRGQPGINAVPLGTASFGPNRTLPAYIRLDNVLSSLLRPSGVGSKLLGPRRLISSLDRHGRTDIARASTGECAPLGRLLCNRLPGSGRFVER